MVLAPKDCAISRVRSFEPESTTTISSAQRTLSSVRGRLASSFIAIMATESVLGIAGRINQNERAPPLLPVRYACGDQREVRYEGADLRRNGHGWAGRAARVSAGPRR